MFWGSGEGNTKVVVKAAEQPEEALAMTATATGVKQITVTFNKAVAASPSAIALKKGTTAANVDSVVFSDDKTAIITTSAKLTKGDYTVEATGFADEVLSSTVTVADDEYVANINITTKEAPMLGTDNTVNGTYTNNQTIKVNYKLENQYGETVSSATTLPGFTASTGVTIASSDISYKNGEGSVYIKSSTPFVPTSSVYVNAVLTAGTHVATANTTVTVALPAKFDKAEFLGVYNTRTKKVEPISATTLAKYPSAYQLLFSMSDQYGNAVNAGDNTAANLGFNAVSNNPVFVGVDTTNCAAVEYQDKTYQALPLTGGTYANKGGKATISVISSGTGTTSTYEINSDSASVVTTFSLQSPADIVTLDSVVEIPFTALDQNGTAVTAYDALKNKVTFTPGNAGLTLAFEKQSDGSAKLFLTVTSVTGVSATNDVLVYSTSVVSDTGSYSSISYNVKNGAIPSTVVGLAKSSSIATSFAHGTAAQTLKYTDLNIADQYGRTMSSSKVSDWLDNNTSAKIYASAPTGSKITVNSNVASDETIADSSNKTTGVTITSSAEGTAKLTFGVTAADGTKVAASEKEIRFTAESSAMSNYESYEVATLPTMYVITDNTKKADDTKYGVKVKVYGVRADGTKVLLPASQFTVGFDQTTGTLGAALAVDNDSDASCDLIKQDSTIDGATTSFFQVSNYDKTYKDATLDLTVDIYDTNNALADSKKVTLTLSNKDAVIKEAAFTSTVSSTTNTAYLTAASGAIENDDLKALIDTTKLKDQYGYQNAAASPSAYEISKVTDADEKGFTVVDNNTTTANITGAAAGDTFTLTVKYAGGYSISCNIVVK